jgi:hypothetical protein
MNGGNRREPGSMLHNGNKVQLVDEIPAVTQTAGGVCRNSCMILLHYIFSLRSVPTTINYYQVSCGLIITESLHI